MKPSRTKAALAALVIAASAVTGATPAAANPRATVKNCEGDARTQSFAMFAYRMTGFTMFYNVGFDAAMRQKFFSCK